MVVCTGGMPSLSSVNRWNSEVKAAALIAHRLVAHMLPHLMLSIRDGEAYP